jgi:lysophospholipase L1-like esterase
MRVFQQTVLVAAICSLVLGADAGSASAASTVCWPSNHGLDRARQVLVSDREHFHMVELGDSTRDPNITGPGIPQALITRLGLAQQQIAPMGRAGQTLRGLLESDEVAQAAATDPDLVELTIGINDWRVDQTIGRQFEQDLADLVESVVQAMPDADVMLSIPGAFASDDVGGNGFVLDRDGEVNPDGAPQAASSGLRAAYLAMRGRWPNVTVVDMQTAVTGTQVRPSWVSGLMTDQVHPNQESYALQAAALVNAFNACTSTRWTLFGKLHLYPMHL